MFKLNLKIAFRNLWKNKGYTLINLGGLSVGMAGCILVFIFIRYQLSYDQQYKNKERIYRVVSKVTYTEGVGFDKGVPMPLAPALKNDFGMLEETAALQGSWGILKVKDATGKLKIKTEERTFYVAPNFFRIFDYKWLQGNPERALAAPNTVAISKETASRFFGDWHKAIGQVINYENKTDLKVTGVFEDMPENTSNNIKIAISYATFKDRRLDKWGSIDSDSECYIMLKKGVMITDLEAPKNALIQKYYVNTGGVGKPDHIFQPLTDIHLDKSFGNFSGKSTSKGEMLGLIVIGMFLLITACINFINLSTAQAVGRSKEVGVRKVLGSGRRQLIIQFLTETVTLTLLAALLACAFSELALPSLAALFKDKLSFGLLENPSILLFLTGMVVFVGFLAGFYPAMVMSGFSPALAIKNKVSMGNAGGVVMRKVLVVTQFAITIILITGTLVVLMQMKYMREKPLGFNTSAVAIVSLPNDSASLTKYDILKARILQEPGVLSASFCSTGPSSDNTVLNAFGFGRKENEDFQVNTKSVDEDYFSTFGIKLLAGRALLHSDTIKEFVVNQTLLKRLNITDPEKAIGTNILFGNELSGPVVGVVKDFNDKSLREVISPILFTTRKMQAPNLAIKMDVKQISTVMTRTEEIWNTYYSDYMYHSSFVDEDISRYYESERIMGTLFKIFAAVIILIAFIGLFGLISFVASQRTKEMAIRKVLGASTLELIKMLNTSFIILVLMANLVAWPIAYILISKWLSGYTYRIELSIWPFVIAMSVSLLITLVTVSLRSYRVANANPVDALKYE